MPIPIKSSELKRSSASCCEIPFVLRPYRQSDQINRIINAYNTFAQHRAVNSQAPLMAERHVLQNRRRRRSGIGVEIEHHAALVFLYHLQRDFVAYLQLAPNQLVFVIWLVIIPAYIKVSTKSPGVEV